MVLRLPSFLRLLGLLAALLVLARPGVAAAPAVGVIEGSVLNEDGDPVSGAALTFTSPALTSARSTTSGASGGFRVADLPVGTYQIVATRAGFAPLTRPGVKVAAADTTRVVLELRAVPVAIDFEEIDLAEAGEDEFDHERRESKRTSPRPSVASAASRTSAATVPMASAPPARYVPTESVENYATIQENGFHVVADEPLSTFAADVDTASYSNVRRFVQDGQRPPRDAVRIEELINYFPYEDALPTGKVPFATTAEVTAAPWSPGNRLVRIGIQAKRVDPAESPARNLVFLVDVSGSMSGADRLPLVKRGLVMLTRQLGARDHVAIVVYAGTAGTALPPTRGDQHDVIEVAINRLGAGGSTGGAAGIRAAYALARENFQKGAINRVLLATDGDFNVGVQSESELTQIIETERESGVFLTVLGVGRGNMKDARMEMLADKGNGNYAYIDGWAEMEKVLRDEIGATLVTVAKDVKLQVEFNPAKVASYRLIGYENRALANRDFEDDTKDAGDMGAGHHVTALYEVVPATTPVKPEVAPLRYQTARETVASSELLTVNVRYKLPDGKVSELLSVPVVDEGKAFAQAGSDTRFAAAVAAYGMLLRGSEHAGTLDWAWVDQTAREALGADPGGYRHAFVALLGQARALASR